jgi:hypothetical protein
MRLRVLLSLIAATLPALARAGLGYPEGSVETDRVQMRATERAWTSGNYRVHELTTSDGLRIREYVAADGVFAVSWDGPLMPNLRMLLGAQFDVLKAAAAGRYGDHTQLHLTTPGLVFHSIGHVRAFHGQAYLPAALPPGVDVKDLQ